MKRRDTWVIVTAVASVLTVLVLWRRGRTGAAPAAPGPTSGAGAVGYPYGGPVPLQPIIISPPPDGSGQPAVPAPIPAGTSGNTFGPTSPYGQWSMPIAGNSLQLYQGPYATTPISSAFGGAGGR